MQARRILSLLLVTAALMSCSVGSMDYGSGSGMTGSGSSGSGGAPSISGFAFHPATITTSSGTTLTWTNHDGTAHTVTSTSGPEAFDSKNIAPGSSYSLVLTLPGTYAYKCKIHAGMKGKIVVQ
jgi:plastocyanin